jgi:hypothetical protein
MFADRPAQKAGGNNMIKVYHIEVFGWEGAIRGMRNPLNSWAKSDSEWKFTGYTSKGERGTHEYVIGEADLALMRKLCRAGSDHRKFLRQIMVSMDITAPLYWWKEFDTYKVGTVANSCSTMHTIHKKPFALDDFSIERLTLKNYTRFANSTLSYLNEAREDYLASGDKIYWDDMIQLLPSSYNQLRTVTFNYEVLFNMYHARRNHRLDEWHVLCDAIEKMPYFSKICLEETT